MSEKSKRRLGVSIAAILVLALVAVGAFVLLSGGSANAKQIATLRIFGGTVEVQSGTTDFSAGTEGQALHEGDTVRTGSDGRASIEYFDGSLTRMDYDTTFELTTLETLDNAAGSKVIEGEQTSGNTYNRVTELTDSASRFDIETPTATASVQGTVYAILLNPDGSVTIAVIEGSVTATGAGGSAEVGAGLMVTVSPDGTVSDPEPIPPELLDSEWLTFNQCDLDEIRDCVLGEVIEPEEEPVEPTESPAPTGDGTTGTPPDGDGTPPEPDANQDPSAGFILGPGNGPAPHTISISDASSDPDGDPITRQWSFGDGSSHGGGTLLTHTYTEPGTYTVRLTVTDSHGATDSVAGIVNVTDGTAPVVEITSTPDDPSDSADASFQFTSSEAGTGFECSLDGGAATGCGGGSASLIRDLMARLARTTATVVGSASYSDLEDGPHTFTVSVTDAAGNSGSASFSWEVDAVADLDHITLSPSASTIQVGQSQAYSVTAFDENGNSMGNVTAGSTISGAGCGGNVCSPAIPGDFTISASYQGKTATALLHVLAPAPVDAVFDHILVQPGAATITYGESQTYSALAVASDGSSMGDVTTDTTFTGATCTGNVCTPQTAGAHSVTGSYSGALGSDSDIASLTVNQATLSVTAQPQSRIYGEANPPFTFDYGVFVLGDDAEDLTTAPTCSTTATPTSNVGGYPITCSGGLDENYSFDYHHASLTITRATLTVTPDAKSKTQGIPNPALTFSITGFKNGEGVEGVVSPLPTCTTTATTSSPVGTYPITCTGGSATNYNFTYTPGVVLTITERPVITVTATVTPSSITYGDPAPAFGFTYSPAPGSTIDTPPTCGPTGAGYPEAGSYTIECGGAIDDVYDFSYDSSTLTIDKAAVSVIPDDLTVTEGDAPGFTFTYSPAPSPPIDAEPTCGAGTGPFTADGSPYTITCSGGSDDNYTLTVTATATLTVLPAPDECPVYALSFHTRPPTGETAGMQFNVQVQVAVLDGGSANGPLTISLQLSSGSFGEGSETSVVWTGQGTLNFNHLTIDEPGSYTITAVAECATPTTAAPITIISGAKGGPTVTADASTGGVMPSTADRSRDGGFRLLGLMLPMPLLALGRRRRRR